MDRLSTLLKPVSVTKDGIIPLRFTGAGNLALSSTAVDYENQLSRYPTGFMFSSLWPQDLFGRGVETNWEQVLEKNKDPGGLAIVGRHMAATVSRTLSMMSRNIIQGGDGISGN